MSIHTSSCCSKVISIFYVLLTSLLFYPPAFGEDGATPEELVDEYIAAGGLLPRNEKIAARIQESDADFASALWSRLDGETDFDALMTISIIAATKLPDEEKSRFIAVAEEKAGLDELDPFTQNFFRRVTMQTPDNKNDVDPDLVKSKRDSSIRQSQSSVKIEAFESENETGRLTETSVLRKLATLGVTVILIIFLVYASKRFTQSTGK